MKFTVTGSSRENGGRMSLELEAESRAAAERKATAAGMLVQRVQQHGTEEASVSERRAHYRSGSGGKLLLLLIVVIATVGAWYYFTHIAHR